MAAAFTGCCPINGSVSRTAMSEQYEGKTQLTGLVAGVSMIAVLLFCTGFIRISAGSGAHGDCHISAHGCHGVSSGQETCGRSAWTEFFRYLFGAFFGVLILGTINGV